MKVPLHLGKTPMHTKKVCATSLSTLNFRITWKSKFLPDHTLLLDYLTHGNNQQWKELVKPPVYYFKEENKYICILVKRTNIIPNISQILPVTALSPHFVTYFQ